MQSFRIVKNKPRKSSKPAKTKSDARTELADAIESIPANEAMVSCTKCVESDAVCYYDREQSMSCAECIRHQRKCDGTFALEEFRKVGEQTKLTEAEARTKQRKLHELRRKLMDARRALLAVESEFMCAEAEVVEVQDSLAALKEISSRMLRREMQVLGVMSSLDSEQEVALADPGFVWEGASSLASPQWDDAWLGLPSGELVAGESGRQGSGGGTQPGA